jgi:beta-ribofuranosylaminobenzene 5'-phosphate synthase
LISMHSGAPRKNGGIGFSIAGPTAMVAIQCAEQLGIEDNRPCPFDKTEIGEFLQTLERLYVGDNLARPVRITITGEMRTHVGMGSGTAIRLAAVEGMYRVNRMLLDQANLVERSGRGGTSGIGATTYFSGKLTLDLGTANDGTPLVPSSRVRSGRAPLVLDAVEMPKWHLCLCVPNSIRPKTQKEEAEFFERTTPLSSSASYRASYEALLGIYASVRESHYSSFCRSIESMQNIEWKAREWDEYGEDLRALRHGLLECGVDCVGMSSLGPMLFCFGSQRSLDEVMLHQGPLDFQAFRTLPSNEGRAIGRYV